MGQEDDAHEHRVNTTEVAERRRVEGIYARYRLSGRRGRAWAADNAGNMAIRDELFDRLARLARYRLAGSGRVLDAGCGTGYWLERLMAAGVSPGRLAGVDLLGERLRARRTLSEVELREADVRVLPYPTGEFDLVLMLTVLSSLKAREDVARAVGEAARVLAPGGMLVVYEPRFPNPLNPASHLVRAAELSAVLGAPDHSSTLTLAPAIARRLGDRDGRRYRRLARVPALRTHRLMAWAKP